MSEIELIAVFSTAEHAHAAVLKLEGLLYRSVRARTAAQTTVRVRAPEDALEIVKATLRQAEALDVTSHPITVDSDWMSHQNGAVTGTGVEPGAGDSEAGAQPDEIHDQRR
jgi:hypothetical protein